MIMITAAAAHAVFFLAILSQPELHADAWGYLYVGA
jgi:hypothetical protein